MYNDVTQILEKELRKEQIQKWIAASCMLCIGLLIVFFCFQSNTAFTILGMALSVLGMRYIYLYFPSRRSPEFQLIQLVKCHPEQIVWVYSIVIEHAPFGLQFSRKATLYFKLLNKKEWSVSVSSKEVENISKALNRVLPHATFGYTRDREQWYMADPALLIRQDV